MEAHRAEPVAAEESNAFARDQLEFILDLATQMEEFFRLQVEYGKALERVNVPSGRDGKVTRMGLLSTLMARMDRDSGSEGGSADDLISGDDLDSLRRNMRDAAAALPYTTGQNFERILSDDAGIDFDYCLGFCTGALSMSRLFKYLAGPTACAPMTRQRLKWAVYNFPSFSLSPSGELNEEERAASALPPTIRKAEFYQRAFTGHLPASRLPRVPPGYEEHDGMHRSKSATEGGGKKQNTTNARGSFGSFVDDILVHIASYAHPSDLVSLSLTSKRFGLKSDARGWSIVEEAARVAINRARPGIESSDYLPSIGESWIGMYSDSLNLKRLLKRNDYSITKLQFIKNWLDTSYFEILYVGLPWDEEVWERQYGQYAKIYADEFKRMNVGRDGNVSTFEYAVYAGWRTMKWLFRDLADVKVPNENPWGLDEDDEEFDEQWEDEDYVRSVEFQRENAINDFPFLDR